MLQLTTKQYINDLNHYINDHNHSINEVVFTTLTIHVSLQPRTPLLIDFQREKSLMQENEKTDQNYRFLQMHCSVVVGKNAICIFITLFMVPLNI